MMSSKNGTSTNTGQYPTVEINNNDNSGNRATLVPSTNALVITKRQSTSRSFGRPNTSNNNTSSQSTSNNNTLTPMP